MRDTSDPLDPDRIRGAESLNGSATGRGQVNNLTNGYEEAPNASSTLGLTRPDLECIQLKSDIQLKRVLVGSIIGIISVILLVILIVQSVVALRSGVMDSLGTFSSYALDKLIPLMTVIVGFFFGRASKK